MKRSTTACSGELHLLREQLLLGHASIQTTERYLVTKQNLTDAPTITWGSGGGTDDGRTHGDGHEFCLVSQGKNHTTNCDAYDAYIEDEKLE